MSPFLVTIFVRFLHLGGIAMIPVTRLTGGWRIFYPDVTRCGGPAAALKGALAAIGSELPVDQSPTAPRVRVARGSRSAEVLLAPDERLFMLEFWIRRVCMATGATPFLSDAARATERWVASTCTPRDIAAALPFVKPTLDSVPYDSGDPVEYCWQIFLSPEFRDDKPGLADVVQAASRRPALRQLFPCTSFLSLRFSRCTEYPYVSDLPSVWSRGDEGYEILDRDGRTLGRFATGDEERVVDLLLAHLPADCGPAVVGSAEDLFPGPAPIDSDA